MPAGRPRQPVSLLKQKGKKHLTKKEIEERTKAEVKTGDKNLEAPEYIKKDLVAYKKWQEILLIYKEVDFISSGDTGFLARYCKTYSEYLSLQEHKAKISNIDFSYEGIETAQEEFERTLGKKEANKLYRKINYIISVGGILDIETAINKKMELLIKMEDRSFLNPLAKVKGMPPPKEKPKQTPLQQKGFGNV